MTYNKDRRLEDQFAALIKNFLAQQLITKEEIKDLEEATDFAIYCVHPFKVAVRLRRFEYFKSFYDEFTIRWSRPSGVKTEIDKIREHLVDYLFYGFLSPCETEIIQYFIADLTKFDDVKPHHIFPNNPPDSELAVYKLSQFPKDFVVEFYCQPSHKEVWSQNEKTARSLR